ncbi:hypothetical protein H9L39_02526 [Fusarium oxysporum f. sp. albedinis]|nr:hypothetical protein H9L39_02526 [Fusarium oxysporum f. sp. albedinis]
MNNQTFPYYHNLKSDKRWRVEEEIQARDFGKRKRWASLARDLPRLSLHYSGQTQHSSSARDRTITPAWLIAFLIPNYSLPR